MVERLRELRRRGLLCSDAATLVDDREYVEFGRRCRELGAELDGTPDGPALSAVARSAGPVRPRPTRREENRDRGAGPLWSLARVPFALRIDDVVEMDDSLKALLDQCSRSHVPASLEVIPYLTSLSDDDIAPFDPASLFEVSQHGYAHVNRGERDVRAEFLGGNRASATCSTCATASCGFANDFPDGLPAVSRRRSTAFPIGCPPCGVSWVDDTFRTSGRARRFRSCRSPASTSISGIGRPTRRRRRRRFAKRSTRPLDAGVM